MADPVRAAPSGAASFMSGIAATRFPLRKSSLDGTLMACCPLQSRLFMKRIILAGALALLAAPTAAQEVIASYYAYLSPQDLRNSRGIRLADIGAILQQDRANFHRFGLRDGMDEHDPLFASSATRARIPELYARGPGAPGYIVDLLRRGETRFVHVRIIGRGGRPDYIEVYEGAG
ncbi:hypothetical protein [Limimaricola cinnabarinus]|uniref:hypothetical protein n=1 Tax=Limimaricola cinnabarinus TaxID=1125964 RepID=UPI002FDF3386